MVRRVQSAVPVYPPRVIHLLKTPMIVAAMAISLSAVAVDDKASVTSPPASQQQKTEKAPPKKEAPKAPEKKKPASKSAAEQKPAAKPCEEVKPCAIE